MFLFMPFILLLSMLFMADIKFCSAFLILTLMVCYLGCWICCHMSPMDYDLHKEQQEQQVPPGLLTGISFHFSTETDIVSTFNWLFIWWRSSASFFFFS